MYIRSLSETSSLQFIAQLIGLDQKNVEGSWATRRECVWENTGNGKGESISWVGWLFSGRKRDTGSLKTAHQGGDFRSQGMKNKCYCSSFCPLWRLHSLPLIILMLLVCSADANNLGFRTCLFCRPSQPLLSNCSPDFPSLSNAHEWLDAIKMGRYKENFDQAGLATFDVISRMTLE